MTAESDGSFLQFARFLKEKDDTTFQEVDRACLSRELFQDPNAQRSVLHPYFFFFDEKSGVWDDRAPVKEGVQLWG